MTESFCEKSMSLRMLDNPNSPSCQTQDLAVMENGSEKRLLTRDGTENYKGSSAIKDRTGGWAVTPLIFVAEFAERLAAGGVSTNLVSYLAHQKHLPLSISANAVTNFIGTSFLMTLVGAFFADTYFGRFWTIVLSASIECMGFVILTMSATLRPFTPPSCFPSADTVCEPGKGWSLGIIFLGLYVAALGIGGVKACVSGFGADQFEKDDPKENQHMLHYFNWFYFAISMGSLLAATAVVYIEDKLGWGWGFCLTSLVMAVALIAFAAGRRWYRYKSPAGSPLTVVCQVFAAAFRNRKLSPPLDYELRHEHDEKGNRTVRSSKFRCLDKAAILPEKMNNGGVDSISKWKLATVAQVEDVKKLLALLPIAASTCLLYTVESQFKTFTIEQAHTLERHIGSFEVRAGSVYVIFIVTLLIALPILDGLFFPLCGRYTGNPKGLTNLERIGVGLAFSVFSMVAAATVEAKRLHLAEGLSKDDIVPMSFWWLAPQYVLGAIGEAFTYPGQLDFFYTEAPSTMQSMGTAFCLCTISFGYFFSSVLVTIVNQATASVISHHGGKGGWLRNDLNDSRLDLFFWLLAVLSFLNVSLYTACATWHSKVNSSKNTNHNSFESTHPKPKNGQPEERESKELARIKCTLQKKVRCSSFKI